MPIPDIGRPTPNLAGFGEALDAKTAAVGSDLTFYDAPVLTFPSGTAIDENTGLPFDPTIEPASSAQTSAVVRCGVFFKAVNRGGAANAALGSPAGWDEKTRIFAIAPISAKAEIQDAVEFEFHGKRFKIDAIKEDEIVLGYQRLLVYAAAGA